MMATTIPPAPASRYNLACYWAAAALIVALGALHVALMRGMFADGAFFLLGIINSHSFQNYDSARYIAQIVYQFPVVAAADAGAESLKFLARLQTFAFVFPVILLYLGALWKVRANDVLFGAFILIVVVVYQNLNFIASSEANLLYALVTFSLAILVQDKDLEILDAVLLVVCAIVGTRTYEAMVFLGPILVAGCVVRIFVPKPVSLVTITLSLAALLFALGSGLALWSLLAPRSPGNMTGAIYGLLEVNRQLWLSSILVAAYAGYVLLRSRIVRLAITVVFVATLILLAVPVNWSDPKFHYISRTTGGILLFAIGFALVIFRFSRLHDWTATARRPGFSGILVAAPLLALVVSAVPDVHHSLRWKRFLNSVEKVVNTRTGLVPYDAAAISLKRESIYGWDWTYPTMSILVRHGPSRAIILSPVDGTPYHPFDPTDSSSIPDLGQHYWK